MELVSSDVVLETGLGLGELVDGARARCSIISIVQGGEFPRPRVGEVLALGVPFISPWIQSVLLSIPTSVLPFRFSWQSFT